MQTIALIIAFIQAAMATSQARPSQIPTTSILRNYQTWRTASSEHILVPQELWALCRVPPRDQEDEAARKHGPHNRLQIRVFANQLASPSFFSTPMTSFPVGSIIVKEKSIGGGAAPVAIAAMVKRAPGASPTSGDWEFFYSVEKKPSTAPVTPACQDCHRTASVDFVFGTYSRVGK